MVTRRRSTTRRRTTSRSTASRRRSGYGYRYPARRRRRGTAASFGSAFGLLLVYVLLNGSWPLKIGLLLLGVVLVVGYLVLSRRSEADGDPPGAPASTTDPAPAPEDRP